MRASKTRTEGVYNSLRSDILNGHLTPGQKLGFAYMGERYEASVGVLREVLPRLVEQGLVQVAPQQGYRVVNATVERLRHLTEARVSIECMVASRSVRDGDVSWEAEVLATHHRMTRMAMHGDEGRIRPEWLQAHEAFHAALLAGQDNEYLIDAAVRLRALSEVYRCWAHNQGIGDRDVDDEHRRLCEMAVARDATGVSELLRKHIELTSEQLIQGQSTAAKQGEDHNHAIP